MGHQKDIHRAIRKIVMRARMATYLFKEKEAEEKQIFLVSSLMEGFM